MQELMKNVTDIMDVSTNSTNSFNTTEPNAVEEKLDYAQLIIYHFVQIFGLGIKLYMLAAFICYVKSKRKSKNHQNGTKGISHKQKKLIGILMVVIIAGILRDFISLQSFSFHSVDDISTLIQLCIINLTIHQIFSITAAGFKFSRTNYWYSSRLGIESAVMLQDVWLLKRLWWRTGCAADHIQVLFYLIRGLSFLYVFLWFRQHTLYVLPVMEKIIPKLLKIFSNSLLPFMIISAVGILAGFLLITHNEDMIYIPRTESCAFSLQHKSNVFAVTIISFIMLILVQGSLLFCFVFILLRHQADMKQHQTDSGRHKNLQSLQQTIRNCVTAATVAMVTDALTILIATLSPEAQQLYDFVLYDLDYLINLICAVICFSNWKEIIDPWLLRKKIKRVFCCKNRIKDLPNPILVHSTTN